MSKLPVSPAPSEGPTGGLPTAPRPVTPPQDAQAVKPPVVPPVRVPPAPGSTQKPPVTAPETPGEAPQAFTEPTPQESTPAPPPVIEEDYDDRKADSRSHYESNEEYEEYRRQEKISALSPEDNDAAVKLLQLIASDESSEVFLNSPDQITFKASGKRFRAHDIQFSSIQAYHDVIDSLILYYTDTSERIETTQNLIEGLLELPDTDETLPPLHARVTVIAPPAITAAVVAIAKKSKESYTLDDLMKKGSMSPEICEFMKALARGKITTVFSGVSGSGKTTTLEAMAHNFDDSDRIILIEDTQELRIPVSDLVPLLSSPRKPGQDPNDLITLEWLVMQANRMRQDRIIVGEIRGAEMGEFLSAASSGSDGSMTTIHAHSPRAAIDRMVSMTMKGVIRSEQSILRDIAASVQIIVQLAIVNDKQVITDITEVTNIVTKDGGIALQPIFKYDPAKNRHVVVGRPTENLRNFLGNRGVDLNFNIFNRTPGVQ